MEPFGRMDEAFSEEVDIPYSGMMNVEKKCRRKNSNGDDSTTEDSFGQSEAYHTESGQHDEYSEEIAPKAISRGLKQT